MRSGRPVFEALSGHSPGRASRTPPRPRPRRALALLVPLLLILSACASDAPQDSLEPEGPIARTIDNLVNPVFIIAAVVFVLVEFGILYLVLRFRQRKDDDPDELPGQTHGNTKLEIGWTVLPALLSKLGDNVDRLRVPFVHRVRRDDGEGRIWGAIIDRVLRRPALSAALAGVRC